MTISKRLQAVAAFMAQADADAVRPDTPEQIEDAVASLVAFIHSGWYSDTEDVIPEPTPGWQGLVHTSRDNCPRCREANKVYWQNTTRGILTAITTVEEGRKDAQPIPWPRWWTDTTVDLPCREPSFDTLTVGE